MSLMMGRLSLLGLGMLALAGALGVSGCQDDSARSPSSQRSPAPTIDGRSVDPGMDNLLPSPTPSPQVIVIKNIQSTPTPRPTPNTQPTPTQRPNTQPTPTPSPTNTPGPTPTPFFGEWERRSVGPDAVTGRSRIETVLGPRDTSRDLIDAPLYVRCHYGSALAQENGLEISVRWALDLYVRTTVSPTLLLKFDDEPPQEETWSARVERTGHFTIITPSPQELATRMKSQELLSARIMDVGGMPIATATWDIAGFRDSFRPLEEKCPR